MTDMDDAAGRALGEYLVTLSVAGRRAEAC